MILPEEAQELTERKWLELCEEGARCSVDDCGWCDFAREIRRIGGHAYKSKCVYCPTVCVFDSTCAWLPEVKRYFADDEHRWQDAVAVVAVLDEYAEALITAGYDILTEYTKPEDWNGRDTTERPLYGNIGGDLDGAA